MESHEVPCLYAQLVNPFRVMVLLDVSIGLRRSQLIALWKDIDFSSDTPPIREHSFSQVVVKLSKKLKETC